MKSAEYIDFLNIIERLKCTLRHSWTSTGRQESVAEHSWRLAVMALLCSDEYPDVNINKVVRMCLIHDFGEALTGDIPAFLKTESHEKNEQDAVESLLKHLPEKLHDDLLELFQEMYALETQEAKLFKTLDNMEALISHNEAPLSTWLENEYEDNLTYGQKNAEWSEWTRELKEEIKSQSINKISSEA